MNYNLYQESLTHTTYWRSKHNSEYTLYHISRFTHEHQNPYESIESFSEARKCL